VSVPTDLGHGTILATAAALRSRQVRAIDLVQAALDRIERMDPVLRSWVVVDGERALAAARDADRDLATGSDRGPLQGIPVAVKDIIDAAGLPTRCGSSVLRDAGPAARDAPVVARLRAAGAIVLGKTVTQEFAAGVLSPPARNPWDPARTPGGSSGGSAVAVATGTVRLALGTDTGGSIRIPAAAVGVCGYKPTFGSLPLAGIAPLAPSLDTAGPLAASVADLWVGWRALAGLPPAPAPARDDLRGVRIGAPRGFFRGRLQPGVADAFAGAAALFAEIGADLVEADWADAARARAAAYVINRAETAETVWRAVGGDAPRLDAVNADLRTRVLAGRLVPAVAVTEARRARRAIRRSIADHYRAHRLDAVLVPTLPAVAVPADDPVVRFPDGAAENAGVAFTRLTMPFNATGQPVLALPCGFADGLPVGLQLAGRPGDDERLFAVAAAWEAAAGWHHCHPPLPHESAP
jgi:aspartyl-tRNA(Asn)/glutamyl-tRNA(Gln) amidotransferase subunit A